MNKCELCKLIQNNLSRLTSNELIELFNIIKKYNINYTKNNNGIFINLNWLSKENLIKINNYISFCIKSQNEISKYETIKEKLNDCIIQKNIENIEDNKNIKNDEKENVESNNAIIAPKQKYSSSMKFYLLKKKFSKQNTLLNNQYEKELQYEDYLIK
tara:strand:+ start:15204 stop:15677 length:474 start_codon:yes stop_codon:yes gene_type:complete